MKRIKIPLSPESAKRFWPKVRILENGCWQWLGAKSKRGYGRFYSHSEDGKPKTVFAHVWAYEQTIGPVPEGKELDHLCQFEACVNPLHFEPVPHKINLLRGKAPAALNAKKTHCKRGHPFNAKNTRYDSRGLRRCKICINQRTVSKQKQLMAKLPAMVATALHLRKVG